MSNRIKSKRFKVLSLFSGCGGSDLGLLGGFVYLGKSYSALPFDIVTAIDCDAKAIATYNANFPLANGVVCRVEDVKASEIEDPIDLIIGGFPCQSFSTVNPTKDPLDERGQLYKEMARLLREKKPKAFIAENVKGMLVLKKGAIFKSIQKEFEQVGYRITYKLVNAADFGIPQKRERVFIVGIRRDLDQKFEFPAPTHAEIPQQNQNEWVGLKTVIDSLIPQDSKYYFSKRAVEGMKKAKNNMKRGLWQDISKPSLTITSHLAKVSMNSRDPILLVDSEKDLYRRFTPREAARIQSFPDTFSFIGSEGDTYRQVGQAIAPVVMWHIAKKIAETLKD